MAVIKGRVKLRVKIPISAKTTLPINNRQVTDEYTRKLEALLASGGKASSVINHTTVDTVIKLDNIANPKHTAKQNTTLSSIDKIATAIKLSRENKLELSLALKQEIKVWFKGSANPLKEVREVVESRFISLDKLTKDFIFRDLIKSLGTVEVGLSKLLIDQKTKTQYTLTLKSSSIANQEYVNYGFSNHFGDILESCNISDTEKGTSITVTEDEFRRVWPLIQSKLTFIDTDKNQLDPEDNTYSIDITAKAQDEQKI